jgi:hypothetical protein
VRKKPLVGRRRGASHGPDLTWAIYPPEINRSSILSFVVKNNNTSILSGARFGVEHACPAGIVQGRTHVYVSGGVGGGGLRGG